MAIEDDDKPRKKITHEIGQDLSLLSVEELTERIALMNSEITRLQEAVTKRRVKGRREQLLQDVGASNAVSPRRPDEGRDAYAAAALASRPLADFPSIRTAGGYGSLPSQGRPLWSQSKARPMTDMANNL